MQNSKIQLIGNKRGFTIIELLIAMSSFAFILLLVTVIVINIGNLSSKSINQTKIDDAVRLISDDIATKLKLISSGSYQESTTGDKGYFCINNTMYIYDFTNNDTNKFLRQPKNDTDSCDGAVKPTATNLLPSNSHLLYLNVTQNSNQYTIQIAILYGNLSNVSGPHLTYDTKCNASSDYRYCNISRLETIVSSRIN
jgi:type II secretory pathway pseudopilin PulG